MKIEQTTRFTITDISWDEMQVLLSLTHYGKNANLSTEEHEHAEKMNKTIAEALYPNL